MHIHLTVNISLYEAFGRSSRPPQTIVTQNAPQPPSPKIQDRPVEMDTRSRYPRGVAPGSEGKTDRSDLRSFDEEILMRKISIRSKDNPNKGNLQRPSTRSCVIVPALLDRGR